MWFGAIKGEKGLYSNNDRFNSWNDYYELIVLLLLLFFFYERKVPTALTNCWKEQQEKLRLAVSLEYPGELATSNYEVYEVVYLCYIMLFNEENSQDMTLRQRVFHSLLPAGLQPSS